MNDEQEVTSSLTLSLAGDLAWLGAVKISPEQEVSTDKVISDYKDQTRMYIETGLASTFFVLFH
jgi:hypothetical protein